MNVSTFILETISEFYIVIFKINYFGREEHN